LNEISISPEDQIEAFGDIERLKEVINYIIFRLNKSDPLLVTTAVLDSIDNIISNISNEINAFKSNRNYNHLIYANNHANSALSKSLQLPLPREVLGADFGKDIFTNLRHATLEYLKKLNNERKRLNENLSLLSRRVDETIAEISNQKGRLDTAISEYQQQFSQAESNRQAQFTDAQNERNKLLDQQTIDYQKKIQENIEAFKKEVNEHISNSELKIGDISTSLTEKSQETLQELETYREQAQNLLHVIGSTGMAGEYQKVADKSRTDTIKWEIITVFSMACLIIFAILTFLATQATDIRCGNVGARAFVAITFGIFAAYGIKQADRYLDNEIRNRLFQLELSSIDPYLANLPNELQDQVKLELSKKLYGNTETTSPIKTKEVTGFSIDFLQMVLN
jgi:hypothetical protein